MNKNIYPGKLIVIEGLDGAGTTTQSVLLVDWLIQHHHLSVSLEREPSDGPIGALIRSVLTNRLLMDSLTLAGMFASDRLDHLYSERGVVDRLKSGTWVILDRYYLSSFAYQASTMDAPALDWLRTIHEPCLIPDLTIFLEVPVEECLNRISANRENQFERFEKKELLEASENQYQIAMDYFRNQGEKIAILDGTQPIETIQNQIHSLLIDSSLII